jgi:hypothetical protein
VQHKQIRGKDSPYEPYSYYPAQSSMPPVPIQQYSGQAESLQGKGYNLPTHLLGDEGETSADLESKPSAQETSDSAKRSRHHTPVLPPMPPQPADDEDDDEEYPGSRDASGRQDDPSPSPLDDFNDLTKALPDS